MKLTSRYIVLLVIASLTGIFAYQAYWLTGLYGTMHDTLQKNIGEAMRTCDYNEMMLRIESLAKDSTVHGEVNISTGMDSENTYVRHSTTVKNTSSAQVTVQQTTTDTFPATHDETEPTAMLMVNQSTNLLFSKQGSMQNLAHYFQRGLHAGIDQYVGPRFAAYDSLLCQVLHSLGIDRPYRLEYLHRGGETPDSGFVYIDTLAVGGTAGYTPTSKAMRYTYEFDLYQHYVYQLTMEPVRMLVIRQMSGILATSFVILIILGFSFWYLVHIILRQKTLEEMKSDFTNNITHELKTPIAVAYAANDALLNFGQADDKAHRDKYLRICQEQLQHLSELVEQILSMSMERRKTFRLRIEEVSVMSTLTPLIEQHKLKADKPVRITIDIQPKDITVLADRTHFGNILSNLIDNAIKYSTAEADINIHCRHITAEDGSEHVELSVSDHGIGIAPDKQRHVFDKFYRVPTGNLHNVKGYGLGLFYVKTMVEKHGGRVWMKSEPGKGSTFGIVI
ncbi:MAG: HAMP domain-containing sensor histidine kinase [Bacteroides sp.]|nr:HAMP domain-containing sensor histidine kinase [Bacteroides sp.]